MHLPPRRPICNPLLPSLGRPFHCILPCQPQSQGNNKLKLALSDKADTAARRTLLREAVQCYGDGLAVTGLQVRQCVLGV